MSDERMRAVTFAGHGGVDVMRVTDEPRPQPGPEELLVRVYAAALNRADTMQRSGFYSAPPGSNPIPGVEIAGEVVSWGSDVRGFERGDRVFGVVSGGGYADHCTIDSGMAIRMPAGWSWTEAVAVPEVFITADTTLFELGKLTAGETVLIHAAGSGVGTACLQLARHAGARVLGTVGSDEKAQRCLELGADAVINYKTHDFVEEAQRLTGGAGVDVIEDCVGVTNFERNVSLLKPGGRMITIGILDHLKDKAAPLDLHILMMRRLQIMGSALRPRTIEDKRAISRKFEKVWLPLLVEGRLQGVIDSVYPMEEVARAHERMEANLNVGKILLTID